LRNAERTGWPTPPDPALPLPPSEDSKEPELGGSSEALEASEVIEASEHSDSSGVVESFDDLEGSDVSDVSNHCEVADGLSLSTLSATLPAVDVHDDSDVVDGCDVADASSVGADAVGAAGPKRCPVRGCEAPPELVELSIPLPSEIPEAGEDPLVWELGGVKLTAWLVATTPILPYVQLLLKEIGPLRLCRSCLIKWLLEELRQRSMAFRLHRQYVLRFLHLHPP
jgi:hypothetical protein